MNLLRGSALLLITLAASQAQDPCVTPSRKEGTCVEIRQCKPLVDILRQNRPPSQDSINFLQRSQCGFEGKYPKVCCEREESNGGSVTPSDLTDFIVTSAPPDVTNHPNLRLLEHTSCGPITQQKIFGGNKTGVFDFPWMALIAYDVGTGSPEFRCGGSLINKRYVLTAAHCVTALPEGLTLKGVRIGEHDLSTERDCDKGEDGLEVICAERYQDFGVESSHYHPEYSRSSLQNDIALIRLDNEADLRPTNVKPICMPVGSAATISQKKLTVTGWGATEFGPRSQDLLQVRLSPVPNEECAEAYKRSARITHKQLCAGGKRMMDSCLGDSGGPLQSPGIYNGTNLRYVQYGIVSFGLRNCGTEGFPGVYTRLTYYMDWLLDTIRE